MTAKKSVISFSVDDCILRGDEHLEFMRRLHGVDPEIWSDILENPDSHMEIRKETLGGMSREKRGFIGEMARLSSAGVTMKDVMDGVELYRLNMDEERHVTAAFVNAAQPKPSSSMQAAFLVSGKSINNGKT